ncbi:uncharacterized protein FIBRA_05462 [Fibroporia radiculosa]|uniref:Uncharacterized protein n=1 Tax=Fibroporia radiculosa TaxID=599839 RepID=J4G9H2_9APHY|nr:uncharacterized protein FIBRA_05462 [Fibroporia radiculosa]CCM03333.1 predicted protein [Fibroporia radiculosa]
MGRSAKLHKRAVSLIDFLIPDAFLTVRGTQQKKTASSTSAAASAPRPATKPSDVSTSAAQEQKKRAGLKAKVGKRRKDDAEGPVLGGADYVDLMLGGRRKAMEEATKLPRDD